MLCATKEGELKRKKEYRQLLRVTRQILNDSRSAANHGRAVRRVVRQTKARVFEGLTQFPGKLVSLFEPHTAGSSGARKWRTGCEGWISVVKRRHGLARCRYHGADGMRR